MKKITNNLDIALPIALWAAYDDYDYDNRDNLISTTSLLNPTRMVVLQRANKDANRVVDVSDLIGSRLGSAIHDSFEKVLLNKDYIYKVLKEMNFKDSEIERVKIQPKLKDLELTDIPLWVENREEKTVSINISSEPKNKDIEYIVSGKYDMIINYQIQDIKSTSVWTHMFGSNLDKYIQQMSIYRWLNQDKVKKDTGLIHYVFTDWSKTKAMQDKNYPQQRIMSIELKLMSLKSTEEFIIDKLETLTIEMDNYLINGELVKCSTEELWSEPDKYKYYKKKNANRATKIYLTEEEAYQRLADEGQGEVRVFKGGAKRCNYCSVRDFCTQYIDMKAEGLINE